eukprot:COSAG06_NODE_55135_length_291_cov_0.697917_1_plen_55_part_01
MGACLQAAGAQVVFHPQNNTTRPAAWKVPIHHAMIVTRAAENTVRASTFSPPCIR